MSRRSTINNIRTVGLALGVACLLLLPAVSRAESIAIIVSKNSALLQLTKAEIRGIYLGEIRFIGGMPVQPLQYPEGKVKDLFLNDVLSMTSKEYKLYWLKKLFQEGLTPPAVRNDPYEIMDTVRRDHWSIGYVPESMVDELNEVVILYTIKGTRP